MDHNRHQDTHADATIPFVDTSVVVSLCVGGAIAYFVHEDICVSSKWILEHIMPHMVAVGVPHQVCIVLDRTLPWKVWNAAQGNKDHRVPSSITAQVMLALCNLVPRNGSKLGQTLSD